MSVNYDGKIICNTLASARAQTARFLGVDYVYREKSTINEHLDILADTLPSDGAAPVANYMAIGNKGHVYSGNASGIDCFLPIAHDPRDVVPYNIVPFIMRKVDKDISDDIRKNYALRKLVQHNGTNYWAYYLKRIKTTGLNVTDYNVVVADGAKTFTEFNYSDNNLYPTAATLPDYSLDVTEQVVTADGKYVSSSATVRLELTEFEIQEFIAVTKILYGSANYAVISEFCLCQGIDAPATGESYVGSPFTYTEVIGAQVAVFLTTYNNAATSNESIGYDVSIGQTVPLPVATGTSN